MLIQCSFFSQVLKVNTNIDVIIPSPDSDELLNKRKSSYFQPGARFQVLYLLHGMYGDYSDWQRFTSIEKYAQSHQVAVVMPSVLNSFYQDMVYGQKFFTYLTEELPKYVQNYFAIARRRENTFVAGLSMGGYGAFYLALKCPEKYAAAASLSGALDVAATVENALKGTLPSAIRLDSVFADPAHLAGTDKDLFTLAEGIQKRHEELPKLFMTVGTEDFIYPINQSARKRFAGLNVPVEYREYPGIHDWDFWDTHIKDVLNWLPLAGDAVFEDEEREAA